MQQKLSSITIVNDFLQINTEYKNFKRFFYDEISEKDQQSLDVVEKELINSIKLLIHEENNEDNLIRDLIGTRVLLKYSIMNQEDCFTFFTKIDEYFPESIHKRLFLFKCIAKVCKKNLNYIWDTHLQQVQEIILSMDDEQSNDADALIYINFLLQYAPDFLSKYSNLILLRLIKIIQKNSYEFDLKYDILSKTNQNIDQYFTEGNHFYSNNGIELLRKILSKIKSIHYQLIKVTQLLTVKEPEEKLKTLEILAALLEFCGKSFLDRNYDQIQKFLNVQENDQRIQYLIARNLIFCLKPDYSLNDFLSDYLFSVEPNIDSIFICGKLQNLKLLVSLKKMGKNQSRIVEFASNFINNSDEKEVQNAAFDLLNTFCLFSDDSDSTIFNSKLKDQKFSKILFKFDELSKSMFYENSQSFFDFLSESIKKDPLETLLFLNNNKFIDDDDNDDDFYSIDQLKNGEFENFDDNIIKPILSNINNPDFHVQSLVSLVLVKLSPDEFFLQGHLQQFFNFLSNNDVSNELKLAIIQSFSYALIHNTNVNSFENSLDASIDSIFNLINSPLSPEIIREKAIKLLCLASKFNSLKIKEKFKTFLNENIEIGQIITQKIAQNSKYFPCIIDSYPTLFENDFESIFNKLFNFMKSATFKDTNSKTFIQLKFFEILFCSYSQMIKIILKKVPELIEPFIDQLIEFCMNCLYFGITELEAQNILSLLKHCLYKVGLEKTIKINNQKVFNGQTNLYKIVFETGSRFDTFRINKLAFKILGFIGTQPLFEKEEEQNSINLKPDWRSDLKYEFGNISKPLTQKKIIYSICSEILYKILDDQSMSHKHFDSLKTLINIQENTELNSLNLQGEFELSFDIFKKMLEKCSDDMKNKFVPLLESLACCDNLIVVKYRSELVHYLIELWKFGSSSIFKTFAENFRLQNYMDQIIPLIMTLDDPSELLVYIFKKYDRIINVNNISFDIIELLIQSVDDEKYEALNGINNSISLLRNHISDYMQSIIDVCIKTMSNSTKYFDLSVQVLVSLGIISTYYEEAKHILSNSLPSILRYVPSFNDKISERNNEDSDSDYNDNNDVFSNMNFSAVPRARRYNQITEYDNIKEFLKLVTSINKISTDDDLIYIQKWLDELIIFCIRESPNEVIKKIFPIINDNQSFILSIFNISFYLFIEALSQTSGENNTRENKNHLIEYDTNFDLVPGTSPNDVFKKRLVMIRQSFYHLFNMKKLPLHMKMIISHLFEFLYHAGVEIIDPKSNLPITSTFATNPPFSLRLTLLNYEKIDELKKEAAIDLEQSFLNNGFLDQYQNFVNINRTNSNDNNNYLMPIYANTVENIHNLQTVNQLFLDKNWDQFNNIIDLNDSKTIQHLFKSASLIQQYWTDHPNDDDFQSRLQILNEIKMGFNSLGEENITNFSRPNASITQSIVYGQQLIELQEMFLSNGDLNNFMLRFLNSDQIANFLYPILLLRIESKGQNKNSLDEKIALFSLCRKSMKWDLMNKFYKHFFNTENAPVEIEYEMMYNKLANNEATESDIDLLLSKVLDSNLEKFVKYQKALFYSHSFNDSQKFKEVLLLCLNWNNSEEINLWSWSNLKLFEIENQIDYFKNKNRFKFLNQKKFKYKGYKIVLVKPKEDMKTKNKNKLIASQKERNLNYFYLLEAIKGYIKSCSLNEKMIVPNMTSIISLLFNHLPNIKEIEDELNSIPKHYYLDTVPLIISYIHQIENDDFGRFIIEKLISLLELDPRAVIYDYSFSLFSDQRKINDNKFVSSPIEIVKNYFNMYSKKFEDKNCQNIFNEVEKLTNNLYKISKDIFSVAHCLMKYVAYFISNNISVENEEITNFINDLDYINNAYFIKFSKYLRNLGDPKYKYELTRYEKNNYNKLDNDGKTILQNLDNHINKLIENYKLLANERENGKFIDKLINQKNKELSSLEYHEKYVKKDSDTKKESPLTLSTKVRSNALLIDLSDDDENIKIEDKKTKIESNDSIEITLSSIPVDDSKKRLVLSFNDDDKDEEKEPNIVQHPKFTGVDNSAQRIKYLETRTNLEKTKDELNKLLLDKSRCQTNINECISVIKKIYGSFSKLGNKLSNLKPKNDITLKINEQNNELLFMKNLCLPMFGTYKYNEEPILIQEFENEFTSFTSAACPKSVNIIGSNGKTYKYILKTTEDLRVDQRNMILFKFLNCFLKTKIKTYSVTPLTSQFGILQFVQQTKSLNSLINENREKNETLDVENKKINNFLYNRNYDRLAPSQKKSTFEYVLRETSNNDIDLREALYFRAPNAETWSNYIINFSKSTAVNSIVGYIIGLGDRHLNNILVSLKDGCTIHIDLCDCFEINQARSNLPEKVPFRLTRNIVKMFGPCGVNGTFRSACEETLALIRENREMIFNILEVFYISPIQIYGTVRDMRRNMTDINITSKKKRSIMKRIKMKLDGTDKTIIYVKRRKDDKKKDDKEDDKKKKNLIKFDEEEDEDENDTQFSVHDHVDRLIQHATNPEYLSQSYSGWAPWI